MIAIFKNELCRLMILDHLILESPNEKQRAFSKGHPLKIGIINVSNRSIESYVYKM